MKFNEFQQCAIDTTNKDILVSAGAGSGKTGTMIERISKNIIDRKVTVDKLLVVTFTNAAASEMRKKLETRLQQIISDKTTDEDLRNYLKGQIQLLGQSDICTLHKFCQTIIKKYFYVLNLDPNFELGDDSQTAVLRDRAIEDVFRELSSENNKEFKLLAATFDDKRNFNKIKTYVFKIHNFLTNQPDVDSFKARLENIYQIEDLDQNILIQTVNQYMGEMFEYYLDEAQRLKSKAIALNLTSVEKCLNNYITELSKVKLGAPFTQNHYFANAIGKLELMKKSQKDDDILAEMKLEVKALRDDFHDKLKTLQSVYLISPDINKLKSDLLSTKEILMAMFFLVQKFEDKYLQQKLDAYLLDFSDLEHFAYKILCNVEVAEQVKSSYQQIYVDEYQDVNDIQEGIISIVHRQKDLFLVGDVKQSIYGFRNTNPQIFLDKLKRFSLESVDKTAIVFSQNYRTDQRILDLVNYVFGILMTASLGGIDYNPEHLMHNNTIYLDKKENLPYIELDIIKEGTKTKEEKSLAPVYRVSEAEVSEDKINSLARSEGQIIAQKIAELIEKQVTFYDAKLGAERPIRFSDITLLCQVRSPAVIEIIDTLIANGIPVAQISQNDNFKEYEIQFLLAFLHVLYNEHDDINMLGVLSCPVFDIDEDELAQIRIKAREKLTSEEKNSSECDFYTCVMLYKESFNDAISEKLNNVFKTLEKCRQLLYGGTIYEVLNYFCLTTHFFSYLSVMTDGENRVNNVKGFISSFLDKSYNSDLVEFLANIEKIGDSFSFEPEQDVGINCVNVETMHHSKGLEYPIVFLIDMKHNFNTEDQNGDFLLHSQLGVGLSRFDNKNRVRIPTISIGAVKIALNNKNYEEKVRLLYVAMTRAKNHLFITGSANFDKFQVGQKAYALKQKKNFMDMILASLSSSVMDELKAGVSKVLCDIGSSVPLVINVFEELDCQPTVNMDLKQNLNLGDIDAKFVDLVTKNMHYVYNFDKSRDITKVNSVTSLNKAQHSVGEDFDKSLMEEQSIENEILIKRGIIYHKVMQFIDFEKTDFQSIDCFVKNLLNSDEYELVDVKNIVKAVETLSPLIKGAKILREQPFLLKVKQSELQSGGVDEEILIRGIMDLVIIKDNEVILVDYKTSNTQNVDKTAQQYALQLKSYAFALGKIFGLPVTKKFLYFFLQQRLILVDKPI